MPKAKYKFKVNLCCAMRLVWYAFVIVKIKSLKTIKLFFHRHTRIVQWGFEYQTSKVFMWSKSGGTPNLLVN